MNSERLLKMADYLDGIQALYDRNEPPEHGFNFEVYYTTVQSGTKDFAHNTCGTVGCVVGHMPYAFPSEIEVNPSSPTGVPYFGRDFKFDGVELSGLELAARFFDISIAHALMLTEAHHQPSLLPMLTWSASPAECARNIRIFVDYYANTITPDFNPKPPPPSMNTERLLTMADYLDGLQAQYDANNVPDHGFNLRVYRAVGQPDYHGRYGCGTVGCIAGHTPQAFPGLVRIEYPNRGINMLESGFVFGGFKLFGIALIEKLFNVTYEQAKMLTMAEMQPAWLPELSWEASPGECARNIRLFVEYYAAHPEEVLPTP